MFSSSNTLFQSHPSLANSIEFLLAIVIISSGVCQSCSFIRFEYASLLGMGQTVTVSLKCNRLLVVLKEEVSLQDSVGVEAREARSVPLLENKEERFQVTETLFPEPQSSNLDLSGSLDTSTFPSMETRAFVGCGSVFATPSLNIKLSRIRVSLEDLGLMFLFVMLLSTEVLQ